MTILINKEGFVEDVNACCSNMTKYVIVQGKPFALYDVISYKMNNCPWCNAEIHVQNFGGSVE